MCGERYRHTGETMTRWGNQSGSIILGNQRVSLQRPRVRDTQTGEEVITMTYARYQDPNIFDAQIFQQGLKHVSQRDYEKGLPKNAASFGTSKSSISRSWIRTTKKQLETLLSRDLAALDIVVVFIDGKWFSKLGVVIALGIGSDGKKHILGIYQSSIDRKLSRVYIAPRRFRASRIARERFFVYCGWR